MYMSQVRESIVDIIKSVTPQTAIGNGVFVEVDDVDQLTEDRQFIVRMSSPTQLVGGTVNLGYQRYKTPFEIVILYATLESRKKDEQRIAEDVTDIQKKIVDPSNFNSKVSAFEEPQPDSYFFVDVDEEFSDSRIITISCTALHK